MNLNNDKDKKDFIKRWIRLSSKYKKLDKYEDITTLFTQFSFVMKSPNNNKDTKSSNLRIFLLEVVNQI